MFRVTYLFTLAVILAASAVFGAEVHKPSDPRGGCPPVEEEIVDLELLAEMLAKTSAIGFVAKIGLKKDIDRMLSKLRAYHNGGGKFTLEQLEEQYNLLLMKIAIQLQDNDLLLHKQLCNAWLKIWMDLSDAKIFREGRS